MNRRLLSLVGLLAVCGLLVGLTPAFAQDTLRIGTVIAPSGTGTVTVPVHLRDITGTPLGRDKAAGLRITGLAMQVVYGPLACVTNSNVVSTAAAGLIGTFKDAATCGTIFEFKAKVPGTSQSYVFNAPEAAGTDPCGVLPLTLDAAAPGDKLVDFTFTLNACPMGTVIPLTMSIAGGDAATLNSDSGTAETVANGGLTVFNGQITVPAPTVELTPDPTNLVIGSTGLMTATMSFALTTDTVVTLASSDVTKATVPATVTILANQTTATFTVTGVGAGSSTITATLPAAAGGDTDTATVNVAPVTIALTPDPLSVAVGLTSPMTVTIGPAR
ncbi:MAG TPA: hypothetical protein PKL08_12820, partial [Thermoanaerobaculaceae bacterium]|nr:hypothetical protein [Thermoanaerobaculaceae bacterium]